MSCFLILISFLTVLRTFSMPTTVTPLLVKAIILKGLRELHGEWRIVIVDILGVQTDHVFLAFEQSMFCFSCSLG